MNYQQQLLDLLESLLHHSHIEVSKQFIGKPLPSGDPLNQMILDNFDVQLPPSLQAFYNQVSSCRIEWDCQLNDHPDIKKYDPGDSVIKGHIQIYPLEEMLLFDEKLKAASWMNNLVESEKQAMNNFRVFDYNDDDIRVGFFKEGNTLNESMFFITREADGFYPVNLSFDSYIEKWLLYKGFQGWQYGHFFPSTENYKRMQHYLPQLFGNNK